jgi:hypothetical protein
VKHYDDENVTAQSCDRAPNVHDPDDGPGTELRLICDDCQSEEPAPADVTVGDCYDCCYCGEIAHVEES